MVMWMGSNWPVIRSVPKGKVHMPWGFSKLTEVFINLTEVFINLTEVFLTLTKVFLCFFLSCKANARVKLAKTGHRPHSSTLLVICFVRLLFALFCVLVVCKCVLPPGDNPTAVNKYINISTPYSPLLCGFSHKDSISGEAALTPLLHAAYPSCLQPAFECLYLEPPWLVAPKRKFYFDVENNFTVACIQKNRNVFGLKILHHFAAISCVLIVGRS